MRLSQLLGPINDNMGLECIDLNVATHKGLLDFVNKMWKTIDRHILLRSCHTNPMLYIPPFKLFFLLIAGHFPLKVLT